jgi:triacylglycerol lipase
LNAAPYVASLTTVNTPHRGCEFAEYLLNRAPEELKNEVTNAYNSTLRKIGEPNPDFMAAVTDLTASVCTQRDRDLGIPEGVFCQSVGSVLKKPSGGKFPLNLSYYLVNYFDGPNDGLVSVDSFGWGEKYMLLETEGTDGISHGDIIDLGRLNKPEFDVREFYVRLVADLKKRGL